MRGDTLVVVAGLVVAVSVLSLVLADLAQYRRRKRGLAEPGAWRRGKEHMLLLYRKGNRRE